MFSNMAASPFHPLLPCDWGKKEENETSLFTGSMWPFLFLTFSSPRVMRGPLMLLSHTLQQPTQRLHVAARLALSSYQALREGRQRK